MVLQLLRRTQTAACNAPSYTYSSFMYTQETSNRYATLLPSPVSYATPIAPPFSQLSTLLPANVTYTTYSLSPNYTLSTANPATVSGGIYGQSAYNILWASLSYTNTVPFTTTMSPTPVTSSELVFPPALYTACPSPTACLDCYTLPADFIWGVASSAWQIEGGTQSEGRGPTIQDLTGALPNPTNESDAVVTDMQYFLYKQDIARLAAIGIPYYSFSISWARIVPFGTPGSPINQQGLDHYDDLINTCIANGVTPIVTLEHDDNPLNYNYNASDYPEAFLYYAKQVMTRFGDRVPTWVTLNEPNIGYGSNYSENRNILMAHAGVYHFYKEELQGKGNITLKLSTSLAVPLNSTNPDDVRAANRYQDFILGIQGNPLFLGTNYPADVLSTAGINLTALSAADLAYINGTMDVLSLDPYTQGFATSPPEGIDACAANISSPNWPECVVLTNVQANGWLNGDASYAYAYITPQYFRQHLGYVWDTFRPKGVFITEFGFNPFMEYARTVPAQRYDLERTLYYQTFLTAMLKAIFEDGVKVVGALGWSIMDNNEFGSYEQQYGMQLVNRTSGTFDRTYKRTMFDYVDWFHDHMT